MDDCVLPPLLNKPPHVEVVLECNGKMNKAELNNGKSSKKKQMKMRLNTRCRLRSAAGSELSEDQIQGMQRCVYFFVSFCVL